MPNNEKDTIRARIEAQEKTDAAHATIHRQHWWQKLPFVKGKKWGRRMAFGMLGGTAAYFAVGEFTGRVNNDPLDLHVPAGGSAIVETFADSMTRELNSGWCPSSSYAFSPSHIRVDMCAFQEGKQEIYIRLAQDFQNHLTRQGYATKTDPDVSSVLQTFNRENHWSITPWSSTYDQYRKGVHDLRTIQKRLATGNAGNAELHYRIENLSYMISNIASNVGSEQANLNGDASGWVFGPRADYFHALGVMSASCEVLQAVQSDFHEVIRLQSSTDIFKQATASACATTNWGPLVVIDPIHRPQIMSKVSNLAYNLQVVQTALAAQGMQNGNMMLRPSFTPDNTATPQPRPH